MILGYEYYTPFLLSLFRKMTLNCTQCTFKDLYNTTTRLQVERQLLDGPVYKQFNLLYVQHGKI